MAGFPMVGNRGIFALSFLFLLLCAAMQPLHASDYPALKPCLNDFVGKVSEADSQVINSLCQGIEADKGVEIAILVTDTTEPDDIDFFAVKTFEQNGIGKEGDDNGILIIIASEDRAWRIEVGYGLEGILNDGRVGGIARAKLVPALQSGDYGTGIYGTLDDISLVLAGEYVAPPAPDDKIDFGMLVVFIVLLIIFIIVVLAILALFVKFAPNLGGSGGWSRSSYPGSYGPPSHYGGGGFSGGGGFGGFGGGSSGGGGAGGKF